MKSSIIRIFGLAIGIIFIWSFVSKVSDLTGFYTVLERSALIPQAVSLHVAYAVPALELMLALYWLTGSAGRIVALVTAILTTIFVAWQIRLAVLGDSASGCGCLKIASSEDFFSTPRMRVAFDLAFAAVAYALFYFKRREVDRDVWDLKPR